MTKLGALGRARCSSKELPLFVCFLGRGMYRYLLVFFSVSLSVCRVGLTEEWMRANVSSFIALICILHPPRAVSIS